MTHPLLEPIIALHDRIRRSVLDACTRQATEELAAVASDGAGDTTYAIDQVAVDLLVEGLEDVARREPLCLVAEGLPRGTLPMPAGASEEDCRWRVLIDPIDGTRGLMYQKRSAWVLTGVAPNRGAATRLSDITLAVQTEIPVLKQHLYDQLWAVRGKGVTARRLDGISGAADTLRLRPSRAEDLAHGFASVARFFPGTRGSLAAIDDDMMRELLGPPVAGKASSFEDQYASTGGQLYELMAGHDRFIADLRPLVHAPLCCHPYDICTALIAEELGVVVTGADGNPADAPMDLESDVTWIGYANARLRRRIEPVLRAALAKHRLA